MDAKDRLYSHASQEFDKCVEKHTQKIKNCMWGMIFHAYNEGVKDGKKKAKEEMKAKEEEEKIHIGDEVQWVDDDGTVHPSNSFIVTDIEDGYISGIEINGSVHFHDEPERLYHWRKTGKHFNIANVLNQMADELSGGV